MRQSSVPEPDVAGTGDGPGKGETPKGDFSCVNFPGRRMKNPVTVIRADGELLKRLSIDAD